MFYKFKTLGQGIKSKESKDMDKMVKTGNISVKLWESRKSVEQIGKIADSTYILGRKNQI